MSESWTWKTSAAVAAVAAVAADAADAAVAAVAVQLAKKKRFNFK